MFRGLREDFPFYEDSALPRVARESQQANPFGPSPAANDTIIALQLGAKGGAFAGRSCRARCFSGTPAGMSSGRGYERH